MYRLDVPPSPPGLVVSVPGLQGVVHLPASQSVQPGQVQSLRALADVQVRLRGREDQLRGDVLDADTA